MKISRSSKSQRGFTLIEMMVVLLIIGVLVSSIVISIRTDNLDEQIEIELNRLQALITLAREEAILQGHDMALALSDNHYRFQWYDIKAETWLPVDDGQVFRKRSIPPGTEMVLVVEDLPADGKSRPGLSRDEEDEAKKKQQEEDEDIRRVVIFPSGEVFPFELILRREDSLREFKLIANEDGDISVQIPDEIS